MNQLEKSVSSKLEATVARQIQAQFQTSGKQALQVSSMWSTLTIYFKNTLSIIFLSFFDHAKYDFLSACASFSLSFTLCESIQVIGGLQAC